MERFTVFHFGFLRLIYAPSGAGWPVPVAAVGRPQALPASGNQGRSRFAGEDEGLDFLVAQSLSCASRRSVEERTGVLRPVCCQPRDFHGVALVCHASNRASHHSHANPRVTPLGREAEPMAYDRLVMPMHTSDKLVSLR